MIKFFKPFSLLLLFFVSHTLTAQVSKHVQFSFSGNRDEKGAYLSIKAKISDKVQLFSTKKKSVDDAFCSSVEIDSLSQKYLKDSLIEIGNLKTAMNAAAGEEVRYFSDSVEWRQPLNLAAADSAKIKGTVTWLASFNDEFPTGDESFSVKIKAVGAPSTAAATTDDGSLWSTFFLCLVTGLVAVLTPCVFPLVPVTVSFFLKRSKSRGEGLRNATFYSLSIILIYTIPTLVLTLLFGGNALYNISTHPVTNLLFFAIFILFAISFFGAFDISLPNSWANKADEKAGKGGLVGIFFMALTLVIVSFSCTGPIVGTLLGKTATQGVTLAPVMGMLGFGIGLALPFSLFAYFPSMLKSLPKSGGWLNTVKVTFGFIELALAMKFLSNVDLAYHWRLLDREIFLVIWIVIFTLQGMYLLGKLKFSHDSDLPFITVPRLFFAIASFCFALYLFPGLWGAPLKGIGGWLPHTSTQDFNLQDIKYQLEDLKASGVSSGSSKTAAPPAKKYVDKLHTPFRLPGYFDLEEGMAAAKILNKPVMLDFTGHSCANCRKMEAEVWADPEVLRRIKEDFVLISLYVDESTELPDDEQYTNKAGEKIVTVGDKNKDFEITKFGFNAQPLYMFLDLNQNPLSDIKYGYDSNVKKFVDHLEMVKRKFEGK
ncbi:protein-disulfide reductase DsbD family protein [Segetibacter aerophilus]|uniref:protein-disulfide reductase DsbD family protein n=1 Tax=Segetibacter aerophilus TaxID=670293 RepID=UPI0011BEBE4F|nr:cytochrome c biogenesis protein CcdA [Segetibacter aerophilus]